MELYEKELNRQTVFQGRILDVHVDKVELPNGRTATREIVDHPGGVGILALDGAGNILTVTQYRYAYRQTLLEIPAGKLERGEDPYQAGLRELREETGATTKELTPLGKVYPSPGYCNEVIHLYMARDLTWGEMDLDDDEFLNVERVPFQEMVERVLSGEITDAKTCIAVLKAKALLGL